MALPPALAVPPSGATELPDILPRFIAPALTEASW